VKKTVVIFIAATIVLISCQSKEQSVAPLADQVAQTLDTSILQLSRGDIGEGVGSLLDVISLVYPEGQLSADFDTKISSAREALDSKDLPVVLGFLKAARQLLGNEEDTREDNDELNLAPVAEHVKDLILRAQEFFQSGQAQEGVKTLLDAILLFGPGESNS